VTAVGRHLTGLDCPTLDVDIREPETIEHLLDTNTVLFHLAGHTRVADSVKDPYLDFESNVTAFVELLLSARRTKAKVIFPSSPAIFAASQPLPLTETSLRRPTSPYGAAKLACEAYAQSFHACYGLDVRIARIFNVYGPGMVKFAIFDFWKKLTANSERLEILGDGTQIRDYLFIDDAVSALLTISEHGQAGEDYNVASGIPVTMLDLARQVAECMGCPNVEIHARGVSFPGDIPKWYADIQKISSLGFRPQTELRSGLVRTVFELNRRYGKGSTVALVHV
jgi:UDP-glucose 4-epimerase